MDLVYQKDCRGQSKKMRDSKNFFAALAFLTWKKGLNDTQLAEKAGYKKQYVSFIKTGKRGLTDENMTRLASALGYSLIDFVNLGERLEATANGADPGGWKEKCLAASEEIQALSKENRALRQEIEQLKKVRPNISVVSDAPGEELEKE